MKAHILSALFLSASLAACGGGGSPSVDNSAAIGQAMGNVAGQYPQAPAYTGAFVSLVYADGTKQALGFIDGNSEQAVVNNVAQAIVASPEGANAVAYKALLSDAGLKVSLMGKQTGTSSITGLPLYAPDSVYVAKLTASGVVIHSA